VISDIESLLNSSFGIEMKSVSSSYNELFADTVAVLYTNRLDAISDNFEFEDMNDEDRINSSSRSFSIDHPVESWGHDKISHYVLAPTRSFIGKNILPSKMTLNEKRNCLNTLLESITEEMSYRWTNQLILTVRESNKRLIKRLKRKL
jgi:hypothetical protein